MPAKADDIGSAKKRVVYAKKKKFNQKSSNAAAKQASPEIVEPEQIETPSLSTFHLIINCIWITS